MSTLEFWLSERNGGSSCSRACVAPHHLLTVHAWLVISHKIPYKRVTREYLHVHSQHLIWTWCLFAAYHVWHTSGIEQFWSKLWMRKHVWLAKKQLSAAGEILKKLSLYNSSPPTCPVSISVERSLTPDSNNESHSKVIEVLTRHEVLTLKL